MPSDSTLGLLFRIRADASEATAAFDQIQKAHTSLRSSTRALGQDSLQLAQAKARLQVASGDLAGAETILQRALAGVAEETLGSLRAQTQLANIQRRLRSELGETGDSARGSSRIIKEAYTTLASELIENYGVDGDIANEIAKMFAKLPVIAQAALAAVAVTLVAAAGYIAAVVIGAKELLDVSNQVGTKSRDDFEKFEKSVKDAGGAVTLLDRAMGQDLTRAAAELKGVTDNLFLILLRESGPDLLVLLRTVSQLLRDAAPLVQTFGVALSLTFSVATASLKTFVETLVLARSAYDGLTSDNAVQRARGLADAIKALAVGDRLDANLREAISAARTLTLDLPTFEDKKPKQKKRKDSDRESSIDKLIFKERTEPLHTLSIKDDAALRAETDAYIAELDKRINFRKQLLTFLDGQAKLFQEAVKSGIAAASDLRKVQFDTADVQLRRLGTFANAEVLAIRGRAEVERQEADERLKGVREEIAAELEANSIKAADDVKIRERKLANQKLLNELLEEEERRHQAALDAITRKEKVEVEKATPGSFRNQFGDFSADALGDPGQKLEGFAALVAGARARIQGEFQQLDASSKAPLQNLGGRISQLGINLAQSGFAALLAGKNIGQALKQTAVAGIAAISQLAAVEAVKNIAYALHALGLTFLPGGQQAGAGAGFFFASAAKWGALAVGAGVLAGALNTEGGGQGGGRTAGQELESTTRPKSQTDFRQRLTPEQEAAGGLRERFRDSLFETSANRLAVAIEGFHGTVENLHNKIDSADENAIFIRTAERNYRVVGHSALRAAEDDGGFVRRLNVLTGNT